MSSANIILVGFMGTGKTTVGQIIAERLGWRFADTDQIIEERESRKIRDIFASDGEPAFRQIESAVCEELIGWNRTVISTGGGIVLDPVNRINLKKAGLVVCLDAPPEEIISRLAADQDRPLLKGDDPQQRVTELLEARAPAYNAIPYHIDTEGYYPEEVATKVLDIWRKRARLIDKWVYLLRIWTPYQMIRKSNPVFDFERRKQRLPKSDNLKKFTLFGFYGFNVIMALVLITAILLDARPPRNSRQIPVASLNIRGLGQVSLVFQIVTFGLIVTADLYYLAITVSSINQQMDSGHWDLLRLTMLNEDDILTAKIAAAEVRAWKIMTVERALLVGSALYSLYTLWFRTGSFSNSSFLGTTLTLSLLNLISGAFYPLWRMRAFIAAGIAISSRVRGAAFAALGGGAVVLTSHVLLNFITSFGGFQLFFLRLGGGRIGGFGLPSVFGLLPALIGLAATYLFYRFLRKVSIRLARRYAFQPN